MEYVNDYIYVVSGYQDSTKKDVKTCNKLNLNTKQWEPMASVNKERRHSTVTYVEDRLYAIAGHSGTGSNPTESTTACMRTIEEYDIDRNTWTTLGSESYYPGAKGIHRHCAVVVDIRIFVLGGHDCSNPTNKVYIFNTRTKRWTSGAKNLHHTHVYDLGCSVVYLEDGRRVIYCGWWTLSWCWKTKLGPNVGSCQ